MVSPQLERYSKQISKKLGLSYPVLCDLGNTAASGFGLVFDLPYELKGIYQSFGIDLDRFNGSQSWQLPMPARYIAGSDGRILDAEVNPDYTVRPEPDQIISILAKVQ